MTNRQIIDRTEWAEDERLWQGEFEGSAFGTGLSVMFFSTETPGRGPKPRSHPYDEVFIRGLSGSRSRELMFLRTAGVPTGMMA
ncbi:cupin [Aureimonas sp. AU20]|nr:cupin [Aureimonas sp. AU20]